ncbi:alpha/beta fold hydrolase [Paracandidimonas soli]|uniref:alpha/beta fold hydrolase n=1 Tax=Paracandidimonas soli TaxID=1917182 RepID=UPI00333F0219
MTWLDAVREWPLRKTRDGRTCYAWHGESRGSAVVLIHGVGMRQQIWAPQVEALVFEGHGVLTYDFLGHGGSAKPPAEASLHDYAVQLRELLDELGQAEVALVGHSMGALIALEFCLAYPDRVKKLAGLNAVHRRSAEQRAAVARRAVQLRAQGSGMLLEPTLSRWFGDPVPDAYRDVALFTRALLENVDSQGYAISYDVFARGDDLHSGRLAQVAVPALFATGEEDANSSPEMSRSLAECVVDGRSVILPSARHMMPLTHAKEVNALLNTFL